MNHPIQLLVTTVVPLLPTAAFLIAFPHWSSLFIAPVLYLVILALVNKSLR